MHAEVAGLSIDFNSLELLKYSVAIASTMVAWYKAKVNNLSHVAM